ncbi:MAG: DEAD/DEAH box helicase, partial [Acidobacteriota bacterium]
MSLNGFHEAVSGWFEEKFGEPTEPQLLGWPQIRSGGNVLIAAPTGSGKTLSAFLCAIDDLVQEGLRGELDDRTRVLYISPLKALANDIRINLLTPLEEIQQRAKGMGLELPRIRPQVRSGDTPQKERRQMIARPPHILVTTPESLYILLTSASGREVLKDVRTVIVDEIHALARDKRGSHLTLSLERLEALTERPPQRIGLSATQKPLEEMAAFLSGASAHRKTALVDVGHRREMDLAVVVPGDELGAVASHGLWNEVYERLSDFIRQHRTTLIFVNTRRLAERVTHQLAERLGEEAVATHHGSLAKEIRLDAEQRLKRGQLRAVVATASLELGIDIGSVDLVCQIGSTRSIALALQRIGRAGHWKGAIPKGRIFPLTRDELLETAALVRAIHQGLLDRILIPPYPLDVLAQQIVAEVAAQEWEEEALFETFRQAAPYRNLPRKDFDDLLAMLSEGISTRKGRRGAYLHRDRVNGKIRGRRGARLAAITSGGAIPEVADFLVKADPGEVTVGTLDEDFAVESSRGDIFLLGTTSWRIRRVESGVVRVEDAKGASPTVPFWRGEAPARTDEASQSVSDLRQKIAGMELEPARDWLQKECGLCQRGADQAARYVQAGCKALGAVPTQQCLVAERFFDEAGGMQLVLHSPLGARINKAWGLALRKKFCRSFNFELQAAATEDGINISLSDQHSFPLESVFSFLNSRNVRQVLIQAMLAVPLFGTRWRWNAGRALQVLRFAGGSKVPPQLLRIRADDLLASVFPESAACLENIAGDIEVPDHPLVQETVRDCLTQAMDIEGLERVMRGIEQGSIRTVAIDTPEPSPFSHEILNANPYAFLDEAPLEERRARAVQVRRTLPSSAEEMGVLDEKAIDRVIEEARLAVRDADELHDALLSLAVVPEHEFAPQSDFFAELIEAGRALRLQLERSNGAATDQTFWVAAERSLLAFKAYPQGRFEPAFDPLSESSAHFLWKRDRELDRDQSLRELLRARLESCGPVTVSRLSDLYRLPRGDIEVGLAALEGQGQILRGRFRSGAEETEWCDRRLLARIHRLTLGRLRREIEPVSPADFMRFLFRWQHINSGTQLHGEAGLAQLLEQLQGFELPAVAWETTVLPGRLGEYRPELLDRLCLSGQFAWGRLSRPVGAACPSGSESCGERKPNGKGRAPRPTRIAPVAFFRRDAMFTFLSLRSIGNPILEELPDALSLSTSAQMVLEQLQSWGACFVDDLVRTTRLLPSQVEEGLWELTAAGLATADGFDSLRALIDPKRRRGPASRWARRRKNPVSPPASSGRWTLLRIPGGQQPIEEDALAYNAEIEALVRQLLHRWGVVFRDLTVRENLRPPWRDLLMLLRRLEARGEVRGGRFVSGFVGEQFALPEALDALRAVRRKAGEGGEVVVISAADPLNLTGIVTPGPPVRPHPANRRRVFDGLHPAAQAAPRVAR